MRPSLGASRVGVFVCLLVGAAYALDAQAVPGYADVVGEYVQVEGARAADTPSQLDRVAFLRLRHRDVEPNDEVEAVVIGQPGFASTPGSWLQLGAQLVSKAHREACPITGRADRKCAIEVWIIDRRGSNLEDTEGLRRAWLTRDPRRAVSYYYGNGVWTEQGLIRRPSDGDFESLVAGPGSSFRPLTQGDLGFLWDWGFETASGDVDALISLLPKKARGANVFLAGHSQGGGFVVNWAGRRGLGGRRGDLHVAGLIFLDGGPSIGSGGQAIDQPLTDHLAQVAAIRDGSERRFGAELSGIELGVGLGLRQTIAGLYYVLRPDAEAVLAPSVQPAHPAAECFVFGRFLPKPRCGGIGLRLTNRAHAGMAFDDDPVPGAMLQTPIITALGMRSGRLDFTPRPGSEGDCAADGPNGARPPCPPSHRQIEPDKVYDWLDGGPDGPAGADGPLNGWTSFDGGKTFTDRFLEPGPNPSRVEAYVQQAGYAPTATNVQPVTVRFEQSGERTVDARIMNGMTWYQSRRYDLDLTFLGRFRVIRINRDGVRYDIDKTGIAAPVYVAARERRENPFENVQDYSAIGPDGVDQSETARSISPFSGGIDSSLYSHSDFLAADDSRAGVVSPGRPGASLVSDTLLPWLLARARGTTKTPVSERLGVESWQ